MIREKNTRIRKIYNEIVIDMNPESPSFEKVLCEDSELYSGDLAYYGRATVIHLDRSGEVLRRYVLEDIFPTSVAAIDLTSDGNDAVEEYAVEFQVNNVVIDGQGIDGSTSGSGFDISVSGNIKIGPFNVGVSL